MAIAGKTGTTDDKYDRWFVGYTPYYTAAVWVGFEQNERGACLREPGPEDVELWSCRCPRRGWKTGRFF